MSPGLLEAQKPAAEVTGTASAATLPPTSSAPTTPLLDEALLNQIARALVAVQSHRASAIADSDAELQNWGRADRWSKSDTPPVLRSRS